MLRFFGAFLANFTMEQKSTTIRLLSNEQFWLAILQQKDITIKQYWDKKIYFLPKYCCCLSKLAEISINWYVQFTKWKNNYRFIAILLYLFIVIFLNKIARLTKASVCKCDIKWITNLYVLKVSLEVRTYPSIFFPKMLEISTILHKPSFYFRIFHAKKGLLFSFLLINLSLCIKLSSWPFE